MAKTRQTRQPWSAEERSCPEDSFPPGALLGSLVELVPRRFSEKRFGSMAHLGSGNDDPDAILVIRAQRGDVAAFEELVERHKQPLVNYVTRTLHDPTEAEDVAQNAFVRVFKAMHQFRLSARFSTWLYAIARNLCLNELRRRSRHLSSSLNANDGDHQDGSLNLCEARHRCRTAAEAVVCQELRHKIKEALAELPEPQRTAIVLLHEEELSYDQIAMSLKRSVAATKSVIQRGRQRLKSRLTPYLRNGHWRAAARNVEDSQELSVAATRVNRNFKSRHRVPLNQSVSDKHPGDFEVATPEFFCHEQAVAQVSKLSDGIKTDLTGRVRGLANQI